MEHNYHPRPFQSDASTSTLKRRRPNPIFEKSFVSSTTEPTLIQHLPTEAVILIIRYIYATPPNLNEPISIFQLAPLVPLRTLAKLFRDAFDAHVLSLDLRQLSSHVFPSFLVNMLPNFHNLNFISLPLHALSSHLFNQWTFYLTRSRPRLQHLMFIHPNAEQNQPVPTSIDTTIISLITKHCIHSLEKITTNSDTFLSTIGHEITCSSSQHNVRELQLQMDDISETRLLSFGNSLTSLKLLYRIALTPQRAQSLVQILQTNSNPSLDVHLRLNKLPSSYFSMFPHVPGLHKLSLFDGVIENDNRGIQDLASCPKLEQVHFEWFRHLSGEDIAKLADVMRSRLKKLLIWRCEHVTDEGLIAVAKLCPNAEVELRFGRDQFSFEALALLGDRVSWGSYI